MVGFGESTHGCDSLLDGRHGPGVLVVWVRRGSHACGAPVPLGVQQWTVTFKCRGCATQRFGLIVGRTSLVRARRDPCHGMLDIMSPRQRWLRMKDSLVDTCFFSEADRFDSPRLLPFRLLPSLCQRRSPPHPAKKRQSRETVWNSREAARAVADSTPIPSPARPLFDARRSSNFLRNGLGGGRGARNNGNDSIAMTSMTVTEANSSIAEPRRYASRVGGLTRSSSCSMSAADHDEVGGTAGEAGGGGHNHGGNADGMELGLGGDRVLGRGPRSTSVVDAYGPYESSMARLAAFPHVPPLLVSAGSVKCLVVGLWVLSHVSGCVDRWRRSFVLS